MENQQFKNIWVRFQSNQIGRILIFQPSQCQSSRFKRGISDPVLREGSFNRALCAGALDRTAETPVTPRAPHRPVVLFRHVVNHQLVLLLYSILHV